MRNVLRFLLLCWLSAATAVKRPAPRTPQQRSGPRFRIVIPRKEPPKKRLLPSLPALPTSAELQETALARATRLREAVKEAPSQLRQAALDAPASARRAVDEAPGRIQQAVLGAPDALRDRALRTADAFDGGVFALGFAAALVVVSGGTTLLAREAGAFLTEGGRGEVLERALLFGAILGDVQDGYVDRQAIDLDELFETGVNAMLGSLDPYTTYEDAAQAEDLTTRTTGRYGGIGITIGADEGSSARGGGGGGGESGGGGGGESGGGGRGASPAAAAKAPEGRRLVRLVRLLMTELTIASPAAAGKVSAAAAEAAAEAGELLAAKTAALLVVGDEILSGATADVNIQAAAAALRAGAVALRRVTVVGDDLAEIEAELRLLAATHDLVITSGGVGPTCDDVTLKAVAAAFGTQLAPSDAMRGAIRERLSGEGSPSDARPLADEVVDKMSLLPAGARLRDLPPAPGARGEASGAVQWPLLQVGHVFVLPGVPAFFAAKVNGLVAHLVSGGAPVLKRSASLSTPEVELAPLINRLAATHPAVKLGSYPSFPPQPEGAGGAAGGGGGADAAQLERTLVTLEAEAGSAAEVEAALADLVAAVDPAAILKTE
uniref:MoaB/Mog domain-containing protein n=1 Tax=Emiliania huxleyi TaxID=2903 RepID=A0A7S3SMR5_EMIHU